MFFRGRLVNFGAWAISRFYQLWKDDSEEYQEIFVATDFEGMMQELTQGQGMWRRHPSTGDFTIFSMTTLMLVEKVWYNFLFVKIKPSLHLSTVTKYKTILLYTMTKGLQFDIGTIIERGLIETTNGRCTGALIHHSLITELCRSAGVCMLDFEEQVQQRLPILLPRVKFGSLDNFGDEIDDDVTYDDVQVATPNASNLMYGDPEVPSS